MKKVFLIIIALLCLTSMIPSALAADATVYLSVSVDGKLLVAAQPVVLTDMTVNGALKAAHATYYTDGENGYTAGIDKTFNMFLITEAWGVAATPYVIINGAPLGADPSKPATADTAPVQDGDNIIICTSSDPAKPAAPVSLTAAVSGSTATVTATAWTLDFTTFAYSSAPLGNTPVIDPMTGAALGTTDAAGQVTVTVPESGLAAIEGLAAINLTAVTMAPAASAAPAASPAASPSPAASAEAPTAIPADAETPLFYPPTTSLLIAMAVVLIPIFVVIVIKMVKQSRLDKTASTGGRSQ